MTSVEEATPLLGNNSQQQSRQTNKISLILGVVFGLLSSFIFAFYNLAVKTWKLDFIDVLFVRSTVQIITFGILSKCLNLKFWPEKDVNQGPKLYRLEGFLLLFQVIPILNYEESLL